MASCKKLRRKKRQICLGDLDTQIILQNRVLTAPLFGTPDFDETFTTTDTVWAMVNTVSGKTFFDNTGVGTNITHSVGIVFDSSVTAETWIELDGNRLDILQKENLDERGEWLILTCVDRGAVAKNASKT
jgi:SPP1 family predicted phage head-tail adaptor